MSKPQIEVREELKNLEGESRYIVTGKIDDNGRPTITFRGKRLPVKTSTNGVTKYIVR